MFGLVTWTRFRRLEDMVRDLQAAVARFEASDLARAASALEATDKLRKMTDRLRKRAARDVGMEDEDDVDEVSSLMLKRIGGA